MCADNDTLWLSTAAGARSHSQSGQTGHPWWLDREAAACAVLQGRRAQHNAGTAPGSRRCSRDGIQPQTYSVD